MKCFDLSEFNISQNSISQRASTFVRQRSGSSLIKFVHKKIQKIFNIFCISQSYYRSELKIFIFSFFFMSVVLWQICNPPEEFT